MTRVNCTWFLDIGNGTRRMSKSITIDADSYMLSQKITVPRQLDSLCLDLHLGGVDKLLALMITASDYTGELSFTVDDDETVFNLVAPIMLVGPEQIKLLGGNVNKLKFRNSEQVFLINGCVMDQPNDATMRVLLLLGE